MTRSILTAVAVLLGSLLSGCAVSPPDSPARAPAPPARQTQPQTLPEAKTQIQAPLPAVVRGAQVPASPPRVEVPVQRVAPARVETRTNESEQVSNLISYVQTVTTQAAEEQRREAFALNQGLARDNGFVARLRLALLLSMPGTAVSDDARALGMLEPLAAGGPLTHAGALRRFATLVHAQVAERVRDQRRTTQLREQLDALKAMERTLLERGQGRQR